jgi:hypothetical protein
LRGEKIRYCEHLARYYDKEKQDARTKGTLSKNKATILKKDKRASKSLKSLQNKHF